MWSSVAFWRLASSARRRISSIVIVYARGSPWVLLNAQNWHRLTQMFVGLMWRLTMKYTRSPFFRQLAKSAISPTARMSRVRQRARASSSVSRSPAKTLSRMVFNVASIASALAHLLEDPHLRARFPRDARQEDRKGYSLPLPVVQLDRPAVLLHDRVNDGKPQARPFRLRREEGVENIMDHVVGDPAAGVADEEDHAVPFVLQRGACRHGESSPVFHRLDGVGDQVPKDLAKLVRVGGDDRGGSREVQV